MAKKLYCGTPDYAHPASPEYRQGMDTCLINAHLAQSREETDACNAYQAQSTEKKRIPVYN